MAAKGKVIAVAQQKGGSGKTMLAAQLAVALAETGAKVAVLDIDPQGSLTIWGKLRASAPKAAGAVSCAAISGWRLTAELEKLRAQNDYVLIDTPPVIDSDARRAIRAADLVLIPLNPSPPDLWAAEGTIKLAAEEKRPAFAGCGACQSGRLCQRFCGWAGCYRSRPRHRGGG
jgi:chromosome partitioning protein